jgi:uncharacterized protein YjbI with pentapeptide repeats
MLSSQTFKSRIISGLPSTYSTKPTQTQDETHITALLEQLKARLVITTTNLSTQTIDDEFAFDMLPDPDAPINHDAFIANAFDFIHAQRESDTSQAIHKKIVAGDMPTPNEILYFSLVTDNVNLLTYDMMLALKSTRTPYTDTFFHHINLLFYCNKLAVETDHEERRSVKTEIENILKMRNLTKSHLTFCNLAATKFAGFCFDGFSFQWLNLENADFSNCIFNDYVFKDCLLNSANFRKSVTSTTLRTQGLYFLNCQLNKANFSKTTLAIQTKGCQWDDTSFTQADLKANFNGCTLRGCHFDRAVIDTQTTIDSLSLSGCDLSGVALNAPLKFALADAGANVKLFTLSELNHATSLSERLNMLLPPPTFDAKQLSDYRTVIANILLNQLKDAREETKKAAITTALQHSLFTPKNMFKQGLNGMATFCGFFSAPLFETTAEGLLKSALWPPAAPPLKNH